MTLLLINLLLIFGMAIALEDMAIFMGISLVSLKVISPALIVLTIVAGVLLSDSLLYWFGSKYQKKKINSKWFKNLVNSKFLFLRILSTRLIPGSKMVIFPIEGHNGSNFISVIFYDSLYTAIWISFWIYNVSQFVNFAIYR